MKKIISLALALVMVLSLSTIAIAAESNGMGTHNGNVWGTYSDETTTPEVYSVIVDWGSMEFTYTEAGENVWNPRTHSYTLASDATWTAVDNAVTVVNHSNAEVEVTFTVTVKEAYNTVTAALDVTSATLDSAVGLAVADADSVTSTLTLSGSLPENTDTIVATVTVTIE